jgi:Uma2 family endonuclease
MTATTQQLLTAGDLLRLPKDGNRYELVKGELRTMPPAGFEHGTVGINLSTPLAQHVRANGLGIVVAAETGFLIAQNPDTVRAPDVGFVRQERILAGGIPKNYWPGGPDLAVEVVSPNDTVFEVDEKVQEWLNAGTSMVWVVNPRQRTVTVYRPSANPTVLMINDTLDGQEVVPGFRCRVGDIFT